MSRPYLATTACTCGNGNNGGGSLTRGVWLTEMVSDLMHTNMRPTRSQYSWMNPSTEQRTYRGPGVLGVEADEVHKGVDADGARGVARLRHLFCCFVLIYARARVWWYVNISYQPA